MCNFGKISLSFLAYLFFSVNSMQTLYKIVPEHCEFNNINKSLIDVKVAKCFKLSRTELYINVSFSFVNDILNDHMGQVRITGYMFRSNEYRKGPIEFMIGFCSGVNTKDFDIPHILQHSNLKCPYQRGNSFYVYSPSPNATNLPPLVPEGRWKLHLDFLYMNKYTILILEYYLEVVYYIGIRKH